jgi:hypothetical protein
MRSRPRRRAGAAIWALTLIGAGCLAVSPVQHARAGVAAPPPGQGGSARQSAPPRGGAQPQPPPQGGSQQQQPPPRTGAGSNPPPSGGRGPGSNDPHSWHNWQNNWRDDQFRRSHSLDSRHERFEDRDRGRFEDRFHIDDFRGHFRDVDFRQDCDALHGFSSVRALLDFLDEHPAIRDALEDHGDLFDFLVNHSDLSEEFDADCTFINVF